MTTLRLVFMGSPEFSVPVLAALNDAGHDVVAVYSQPPRPAGRGQKERRCAVHDYALEQGISVYTPKSFKEEGAVEQFQNLNADAAIVVAYGLILPSTILDAPKYGCINVHASLLPRWRGAAPIHRAILAGDDKSGVCIMQMDEGLDTGPVLLREETPITERTTVSVLHDRLSELGAALINPALDGLIGGTLAAENQPGDGVTYAHKLEKSEGLLDWSNSAEELERKIRAFIPWPGVWFEHDGERIKILSAEIINNDGAFGSPGTVLDDQFTIACGTGSLRPTCLQRPGKQKLILSEFLRGYPVNKGLQLTP
jgi:methionyl-tRNA formyltransferase